MSDFDSNEFYPHEKRGGLDRLKEKLSVAQETKGKLQKKMDEVDSEIRDLNDKIFELEDGRLLQAIKNILKAGKSPDVAQKVKVELEKIDLGAVAKPGRPPKAAKVVKPPKAAKLPKSAPLADDDVPPNPNAIAMPTPKNASGRL
jgi:hypothetical protein